MIYWIQVVLIICSFFQNEPYFVAQVS